MFILTIILKKKLRFLAIQLKNYLLFIQISINDLIKKK